MNDLYKSEGLRKNLYSVFDVKGQVFGFMFFARNHGEALRVFSDAVGSEKSVFYQHPEDYQLFCNGSMNEESGILSPLIPVMFLSNAVEFSRKLNGSPEVLHEDNR